MLFGRRKRRISRLLLVEDEPLVAFDTEHMLRDEGFTIVATLDRVADAVKVIGSGTEIDLLLVDMTLADGSGADVANAAHERGIPVLFVTGSRPPEAQSVIGGYLSKPFVQRDLVGAIDAIDATTAGKRPKKLPSGFQLFEQV